MRFHVSSPVFGSTTLMRCVSVPWMTYAVDEELRRLLLAFVRHDAERDVLPLGAVDIAQAIEPHQTAVREDLGAADETAGRSQYGDLCVAEACDLADCERVVPLLTRERPRLLREQ
jgi:hypothetical protein